MSKLAPGTPKNDTAVYETEGIQLAEDRSTRRKH
jgi:hypothetical protein